jgi:hypothetical protein
MTQKSIDKLVESILNEEIDNKVSLIMEKLKGNQDKLDVAEPKGKLTADDFKKLRSAKKSETKEEEQRIAGERGRFLEEKRKEARTITEKFKDPITKTISFASKDWQIDLLIGDIEASNPEYLQLRTWNQEDLFNFVIINDEIRVNGFTESNDIIIQKLEFLEPIKDILSVMFNKIFNTIKIDRKIYYSNKIKEVFKYLTLS